LGTSYLPQHKEVPGHGGRAPERCIRWEQSRTVTYLHSVSPNESELLERRKSAMEIKTIGVVGCGLMGTGIAQICAQSGYGVVVSEAKDELLKKGLTSIDSVLNRSVEKGKISQPDKDAILARIKGTTNVDEFSQCDFVIEAVNEDMDLKQKVFAQLDKVCPEHAILSSNTSSMSIVDIALATARPEKVAGMHFNNPAPVMRILEIVKSILTSEETVGLCRRLGESLGKTVVLAPDVPGFLGARLATPFLLHAVRTLEAGLGTREDMGPLELLDLIGLDTEYNLAKYLYEELKEPQYAPPVLMKKMVTAGWLGRKTGKGFYDYK
jgi:3-hydroxybutyryl-CoA dehydrogenase